MLSDASKSKLFEIFKRNSKAEDYRLLAQQFKVSIERVKAIIKQKELELELSNRGNVVDKDFVSILESNLECVDILDDSSENKAQNKKFPFRPMFACVPEGRGFNFKDAKDHLILSGINIKVPNLYLENSEKQIIPDKSPRFISNSPYEKSRSKFVFVNVKKNISKPVESDIFVRDCDGTLRTATVTEIKRVCEKTWNRNSPKITK